MAAAVLAADITGYSRLMEADEAGTLETLESRKHNVLLPLLRISRTCGEENGDSVLAEFRAQAVECAIALNVNAEANGLLLQDGEILLRIGINVGDVVVEGTDL